MFAKVIALIAKLMFVVLRFLVLEANAFSVLLAAAVSRVGVPAKHSYPQTPRASPMGAKANEPLPFASLVFRRKDRHSVVFAPICKNRIGPK